MFQSLHDLIEASHASMRPNDWTHVKVWELSHNHETISIRRRRNGSVLLKVHLAPEHARDVFLSKDGKRLFLCNVGMWIRVMWAETSAKGFVTVWLKLSRNKRELANDAVEFLIHVSIDVEDRVTIVSDGFNDTESDEANA